jgi:mono/diheme cytochrome c family protein
MALCATALLLGACRDASRESAAPAPIKPLGETLVARGDYLANGVGRCFWCHSAQNAEDPSSPKPEMLGAGDVLDPAIPVIAPNLTPDRDTGLGLWSDAEIARAIRQGIGRDRRPLRGEHPSAYYSVLSDDDAAALVAYLRTLKAIRNPLPRSAPQAKRGESVQRVVEPLRPSTLTTPETRGAYLVQLGECLGCHTTTTAAGEPHRALAFGGGRRFVETRKGYGYELSPDAPGAPDPKLEPGEKIVTSANLTPDPSGIPYYTPELFVQTIRSGKVGGVRPLSSAMPWIYFRRLSDNDLRDMFAYLKTVKPVAHSVNNTDPPTPCEVCGRAHGLGDTNRR